MAKNGRPQKLTLVVSEDERADLKQLTERSRVNRGLAFRARLILACAEPGEPCNAEVARRVRTSGQTVGKWRDRFIARRMEGLYDEPRVGGPRTITDEAVEALVVQ